MGVRILNDHYDSMAAMYCSTTDVAFGPVFNEDDGHDASERIESFLRYLNGRDPRRMSETELLTAYAVWRTNEAAQWKREAEAEEAEWKREAEEADDRATP